MSFELMELTFTVAEATHESVFSIYERETMLVIEVINHLIERAENQNTQPYKGIAQSPQEVKQKDFWDFV